MDVIYGHAYLTLISLSGIDSNCALPGIQPDSRPRIVLSHEYRANLGHRDLCMQFMASPPSVNEISAASTYETRGWTFQEHFLSRRVLYFSNWQVYYLCQAGCQTSEAKDNSESDSTNNDSVSGENDVSQSEPKEQVDDDDGKSKHQDEAKAGDMAEAEVGGLEDVIDQDLPFDNPELFENYATFVDRYTSRQLTFQSDILNAFQGILNMLSKSTGSAQRFNCGLHEEYFDLALLWIPSERNRRRDVKLEGDVKYPTWSWAGWVGPVSYSFMIQGGYL
jgi:hypothetical protein